MFLFVSSENTMRPLRESTSIPCRRSSTIRSRSPTRREAATGRDSDRGACRNERKCSHGNDGPHTFLYATSGVTGGDPARKAERWRSHRRCHLGGLRDPASVHDEPDDRLLTRPHRCGIGSTRSGMVVESIVAAGGSIVAADPGPTRRGVGSRATRAMAMQHLGLSRGGLEVHLEEGPRTASAFRR